MGGGGGGVGRGWGCGGVGLKHYKMSKTSVGDPR